MGNIVFTKRKLSRFIIAHNEAIKNGQTQFIFENNEILVSYAKYMIQYIQLKLSDPSFVFKPNNINNQVDTLINLNKGTLRNKSSRVGQE